MNDWTLRARVTALLAAVLLAFVALSMSAYLTSTREANRLQSAFAEEMSVVGELPAQRALLRQIDADSDGYLLTRRAVWLKMRQEKIAEFRAGHADIARHMSFLDQQREWAKLGKAFDGLVADQDSAIARARAGRMTPGEAMKLALANTEVDAIIERMSRLGRLGFRSLDVERAAARAAALATFLFVLGVGILGALALATAVSRIVVAPVLRLRDQAAAWKLGQPWPAADEDGAREIRDLTATMQTMTSKLNEQYERERSASELKSQLVSGVSHEFNNALAVIHTAHVLLQESGGESEENAPWHEMLEANIRSLSAMATNLLNLGRLEAGRFALETRRVEIAPLLSGTLDRLAVLGRHKKLDIHLDVQAGLPAVAADADAISLVVANLLTNAFKYTPESGAVTLGARRLGDGAVEIFVQDTGIGIAPEERRKILDGWYRTEQGKRTAKGFGVGLALSRMILEAHDAALAFDSEPGKGSRFRFALPPYKSAPAAPTDKIG
ncbi:MAG: HAMP domain-containing histidine kinase [Elusimicrobia bacterium]|nr:HAMP domain-containing histidine kinase [Elusimicrobiota bacterium]